MWQNKNKLLNNKAKNKHNNKNKESLKFRFIDETSIPEIKIANATINIDYSGEDKAYTINGTKFNDSITGTDFNDVIKGNDGKRKKDYGLS